MTSRAPGYAPNPLQILGDHVYVEMAYRKVSRGVYRVPSLKAETPGALVIPVLQHSIRWQEHTQERLRHHETGVRISSSRSLPVSMYELTPDLQRDRGILLRTAWAGV
jgi:hypothetical protein